MQVVIYLIRLVIENIKETVCLSIPNGLGAAMCANCHMSACIIWPCSLGFQQLSLVMIWPYWSQFCLWPYCFRWGHVQPSPLPCGPKGDESQKLCCVTIYIKNMLLLSTKNLKLKDKACEAIGYIHRAIHGNQLIGQNAMKLDLLAPI